MKVLGLGSKHPTELVVLLLNKVTKSGVLRGNKGSKGHLLLFNGPKGGMDFFIVRGGSLGRGTRSSLRSKWAWRSSGLNNLSIAGYLLKVSSVK